MSLRKAVRSLVKTMSKAEQLELFLFLRDDEALKAYRALAAETDRVRQHQRERTIRRKAEQADHIQAARERRQPRVKLDRPNGHAGLRAYTAEEFMKL